ncbi:MAG: MaoC family dehydratase N-terminal domain-containing protein, partial [Acidimicrobiales bacterium]
MTADELLDRLRAFEGRSYGPAVTADDPVNLPMIRHWVEAMGDTNPVYLDDGAAEATGRPGIVAPAVMLQVWSMRGLKSQGPRADGVQSELLGLLEE